MESSTAPPPPAEQPTQSAEIPLSRNALKKIAKAEKFAALKLDRRAREKEAKKEKKRERAEKRAAGELDSEDDEEKKRQLKRRKVQFGGHIVVDLGFDDMMNEKEIKSLCSQLAYTYSANRNAAYPFSLIFTSLNGRTYERLESLGDASYKRWPSAQWTSEGYEKLWGNAEFPVPSGATATARPPPTQSDSATPTDMIAPFTGPENTRTDSVSQPVADLNSEAVASASTQPNAPPKLAKCSVVYLTADTEDELTELRPDETYIIGGIVDHNRYKNLCLNKAKESGIRTARLPIGRYLANLPTRKVLTVNQVFEILVKWAETKDWEEALYSVIPKRKFHQGGKGSHDAAQDGITVVAEAEETGDEAAGEEEQGKEAESAS
ncbi:hypothetical protein D9619_000558 [Psilocybe cf. subviscida]|uniref:tRNA (guanine(9)-N1)-methyltransferase n=1 Tax=Psilocybe cf. subviscida TaxID=2480587 RepID=A0A8H5F2E5_9AGAR|nr:hypothetical protein D9619_000558 [Psilocybe cf. subviscida]